MYSFLVLFSSIICQVQGSICRPKLSDRITDVDIFKQVECEVSTCGSVSQLMYEKKNLHKHAQWTPVYERFNKTYYHALANVDGDYSLLNRSVYTTFNVKDMLYINPVIIKDQGEWRCVVFDVDGVKYQSTSISITIHVTPAEDLRIVPNHAELFINQTTEFMCIMDGIHPEPEVLWKVNGTEQYTGAPSNKQHADGLWFVMNTITVGFDTVGVSHLQCLMRTDTRDIWLQKEIGISVKDTNMAHRPVTPCLCNVKNTNSNININISNQPSVYLAVIIPSSGFVLIIIGLVIILMKRTGRRFKYLEKHDIPLRKK